MTHVSNYYVFKRTLSNQQINMRKKKKTDSLLPTSGIVHSHLKSTHFYSEVGIYNERGPFISRKKSINTLRTKPITLIKGMHLDPSKTKG